MILRASAICCSLFLAGGAAADICDELPKTHTELEQIDRIPASEAYQRSLGLVVFMDAPRPATTEPDGLSRESVALISRRLVEFQDASGVGFQLLAVIPETAGYQSHLCFNADACYSLTTENLPDVLNNMDETAQRYGLVP